MASKYARVRVEFVPTATAEAVAKIALLVSQCANVREIRVLPSRSLTLVVRVLKRNASEVNLVLWACKKDIIRSDWS